jgi:hypothetical protein
LCKPSTTDSNRRRWENSDLWKRVEDAINAWSEGATCMVARSGKAFREVSEEYVRFLTGAISGGMARFDRSDPSLKNLLDGLAEHGRTMSAITREAKGKAELFSKLYGEMDREGRGGISQGGELDRH